MLVARSRRRAPTAESRAAPIAQEEERRRAAAGRSLLDECDHRAADGGVIAIDGEHSCAACGRRDRIATKGGVAAHDSARLVSPRSKRARQWLGTSAFVLVPAWAGLSQRRHCGRAWRGRASHPPVAEQAASATEAGVHRRPGLVGHECRWSTFGPGSPTGWPPACGTRRECGGSGCERWLGCELLTCAAQRDHDCSATAAEFAGELAL